MTQQEKEQELLRLNAIENGALAALNDSDYICAQITEGVEGVDAKYNNKKNYPQYGGNWKKFRAAQRELARTTRAAIEKIKAVEPEDEPTAAEE